MITETINDILRDMRTKTGIGDMGMAAQEWSSRIVKALAVELATLETGDFQCRAAQCKRVRAEMQGVIDELRERVAVMEAAQEE